MGKPKSPTSTSPQVVATLSSLLLLVVSVGLGFYFTELRGPGIRTLLSGSQASELLVLVGGLAAILITGHLAIANAARSTQGASAYRKLVRRASEVDHTDPEAVSQFDAYPELRDFLNVLIAEKQQGHQLQDSLESARGETQGLFAGMERSLKDLGKMREDQPSELGRKVSTLWNSLVERAQQADVRSTANVPTSRKGSSSESAPAMEQRLRDLEARVEQLLAAGPLRASQLLVTEEDILVSQERPLLMPEGAPEVFELPDDHVTPSPLLSVEKDPQEYEEMEVPALEALEPLTDEELDVAAPQMAVAYSDQGSVIFQRANFERMTATEQQTHELSTAPEVELAAESVPAWQEDTMETSEAKALTPSESSAAGGWKNQEEPEKEHTFTEWSGAGFGSLSSMTPNSAVGLGTTATAAPSTISTSKPVNDNEVGFGKPVTGTPRSQAFSFTPRSGASAPSKPLPNTVGMSFPKFGTQASLSDDDHVEVTYEGSTALDARGGFPSFDSPAEEVFIEEGTTFEIDDDVVDLKSLGAVETTE